MHLYDFLYSKAKIIVILRMCRYLKINTKDDMDNMASQFYQSCKVCVAQLPKCDAICCDML